MKKLGFTFILFVAFQTTVFCQNGPVLDNAVSKIKSAITDHIIERAYLHFDRPYLAYVAGETVYFKAYVVMGELHEPSRISGLLHVDLIGKNDALLQTRNIQLTDGIGWGDFTLPDTLAKGSYRVRAYTQWMRNGDPTYFFNKTISVGSINNLTRTASIAKVNGQPAITFFPEGGNLLTDVPSKIAFKAIGTDGMGLGVKGMVFDSDNKAVARIASTHLGMGEFNLLPENGKTYKAKLIYGDGSQATVDLPMAEAKGVALAVNTDDPSKLSIDIKASQQYLKENLNKELNLLVYWSGSVKAVKTKLDNQVLGLDIPANTLKTGIVQITLFSENGEPLSERLAFVQNPDLLNLSIATDKQVYAKNENVKMALQAKNKDNNPVNGSFSVSVIDEGKVLVEDYAESTILTNLLLTSDLKGYIEKPNYYFTNADKDTRANLDVLMLTQGYRRFEWKKLLNDNDEKITAYKPEGLLDISGNVKTKEGGPLTNTDILLLSKEGGVFKTQLTDANGNFEFKDMAFNTGDGYIIKVKSGKKNAIFTFNKPVAGAPVDAVSPVETRYNSNADVLASLQNSQAGGVVTASNEQRLYIKDDNVRSKRRNDNYPSSNIGGPGHADQVIHGEDIHSASSLSSALNGIVRNVSFVKGVPFLASSAVVAQNSQFAEPMAIVVDGIIIKDGSVDDYNPALVETVEILSGPNAAIYGEVAGSGVIVITSRQGRLSETASKEMSPGVYSFSPVGYYKAKEFYSPVYDAAHPAGSEPDNRTTIFWKPDLLTDAEGKVSFNFFNSGNGGTYRVVVEGIDSKGNLGRQVYKFKVQ